MSSAIHQHEPLNVRSRIGLWPILALLAAGCSGGGEYPSTLDRIRETGSVRIAYANEAPYGYKDTATGRVTGEAPEIARAVLERMGVEHIETSLVEFGQLIPGLQANRFDLIAAGMYITPVRCRQIDFSNPTYCVGEAFLVKENNPRELHSFEDVLENTEARLGVVSGTVELRMAEEVGIPDSRVVVFPDNSSALAGLKAGRIDAFAGTSLTIQDLLSKSPGAGLAQADPFTQPEISGRTSNCGAFGFRQDDDAFREEFNRHLAEFIGTPEHLELVRSFGFSEEQLPGDVTAAELCRPLGADVE